METQILNLIVEIQKKMTINLSLYSELDNKPNLSEQEKANMEYYNGKYQAYSEVLNNIENIFKSNLFK